MSIYSDVRTAIRNGTLKVLEIAGFPSTPIIYSHQNGSEPSVPYCVIQIVNMRQIGRTQEATRTDEGTPTVKNLWYTAHYEVLAQFTFGGTTAPEMGEEFLHIVNNNRVGIEEYQKGNLAPLRKTILRRIPQKRDTQWVEFFSTDVTFSYAVQSSQPIDWIESVTVINDMVDPPDTFTIPEQ